MTVQAIIEARLKQAFTPDRLEVIDESHLHAGHHHTGSDHHEAFDGSSQTHFRVRITAESFAGKSRLERHRAVNEQVQDLMSPGGVHALAIEASAPGEATRR